MSQKDSSTSRRQSGALFAIALVTLLFFVWGLTMNLVSSLNAPMANYLELSTTQASLLQVAYYGAYFIMAIPAAAVAKRFGYKGGVIMGLALFVLGSLITVPATNAASYAIFLVAMFVVAAGASTLETNCNPYITKLGDEEHESLRLNLAQSFNGVGSIVGPLIMAQVLGQTISAGQPGFAEAKLQFLTSMRGIYVVIAIALAIVLTIFVFVKLPTPPGDVKNLEEEQGGRSDALKRPYFKLGVLAEFLYVGIQTVGFSLFVTYANKQAGLDIAAATGLLGVLSLCFAIGRFASTPLFAKADPGKLLGIYMSLAAVCFFMTFLNLGMVSVVAFIIAFLFMSIGYPTVFSLTLRGMHGADTKNGSSAIVMSIIGGALIPLVISAIGDAAGLPVAMLVTVPCLVYVAWYGFTGCRVGLEGGRKDV